MFFSLSWILLLSVLGAQAPETPGTKIITRHTLGPVSSEQTLYIMPDRRRIEIWHSLQRRNSDGSPEVRSELSSVLIVRCDLGQSYVLHPVSEEYSSSPYPPKRPTPDAAASVEKSDTATTAKPTLRVETTTVDTGERKEMFGYVARHVIATTKQTPLDGSNSQPSQSVKDGWYIDIDLSISCDPKPSPRSARGFVYAWAGVGGRPMPPERPEFVDIGTRETGLPLKETRTHSDESEVTLLERATLDPTLFDVPLEYKQVERSQKRLAE